MNNRIETFDILKGIGILLVIVGHTFMKEIGPFILAFHMPLFFIVAGYFYKHIPLVDQIRKDFRRLVVPYLFIVVSISIIACLRHFLRTHEVNLFLSTMYECGTPAWFLLALFGAKVLFNIICKFFIRHYFAIAFILSSIPCIIAYGIEIDPFLSIGSSFCGVFFYAVGYYVKNSKILCKLIDLLPYSSVLAFIFWLNTSIFGGVDMHYCVFDLWIIDFVGACSGVFLCYLISLFIDNRTEKAKRLLANIGYFSLVIYSFHAIEYVFPEWHQIVSFSDGTMLRPFVVLMFRMFFAFWAILLTNRIPILKYMFFPNICHQQKQK